MAVQIQIRRDTAANWTAVNPILAQGEEGFETDTGKLKFGDGVTHWAGLAYFGGAPSGAAGGNLTGTYPNPTIADVALLTTKGDLLGRGAGAPAARLAVGADGQVLTADAASTLGIKWAAGGGGGGAMTQLFDSLLGADTASIDTGAGGVATTANHLLIVIGGRTSEAVSISGCSMILNNDSGANYDLSTINWTNAGGVSGTSAQGGTSWGIPLPGNNAQASVAGTQFYFLPLYSLATFFKTGWCGAGNASSSNVDDKSGLWGLGYRSTTAVSRVKITAVGGSNLKAGTRMTIYGLT